MSFDSGLVRYVGSEDVREPARPRVFMSGATKNSRRKFPPITNLGGLPLAYNVWIKHFDTVIFRMLRNHLLDVRLTVMARAIFDARDEYAEQRAVADLRAIWDRVYTTSSTLALSLATAIGGYTPRANGVGADGRGDALGENGNMTALTAFYHLPEFGFQCFNVHLGVHNTGSSRTVYFRRLDHAAHFTDPNYWKPAMAINTLFDACTISISANSPMPHISEFRTLYAMKCRYYVDQLNKSKIPRVILDTAEERSRYNVVAMAKKTPSVSDFGSDAGDRSAPNSDVDSSDVESVIRSATTIFYAPAKRRQIDPIAEEDGDDGYSSDVDVLRNALESTTIKPANATIIKPTPRPSDEDYDTEDVRSDGDESTPSAIDDAAIPFASRKRNYPYVTSGHEASNMPSTTDFSSREEFTYDRDTLRAMLRDFMATCATAHINEQRGGKSAKSVIHASMQAFEPSGAAPAHPHKMASQPHATVLTIPDAPPSYEFTTYPDASRDSAAPLQLMGGYDLFARVADQASLRNFNHNITLLLNSRLLHTDIANAVYAAQTRRDFGPARTVAATWLQLVASSLALEAGVTTVPEFYTYSLPALKTIFSSDIAEWRNFDKPAIIINTLYSHCVMARESQSHKRHYTWPSLEALGAMCAAAHTQHGEALRASLAQYMEKHPHYRAFFESTAAQFSPSGPRAGGGGGGRGGGGHGGGGHGGGGHGGGGHGGWGGHSGHGGGGGGGRGGHAAVGYGHVGGYNYRPNKFHGGHHKHFRGSGRWNNFRRGRYWWGNRMWWFLNGYWFDNVVAYKLAKLAYNTGMPFVGYTTPPGGFEPVYYA